MIGTIERGDFMNYYGNSKDKDQYITNYEIDDNHIEIYGKGIRNKSIPYSLYTEHKVLNQMETQVDSAIAQEKRYKIELMYASLLYVAAGMIATQYKHLCDVQNVEIPKTFPIVYAGGMLLFVMHILRVLKKTREIKKFKLYREMETELNSFDLEGHPQILGGLNIHTRKLIKQTQPEEPKFNVNVIDSMNMKQLKKLRKNMILESELDQFTPPEEAKRPKIKK